MNEKPTYYDGSVQHTPNTQDEELKNDQIKITAEMRANVSGNPYTFEEMK